MAARLFSTVRRLGSLPPALIATVAATFILNGFFAAAELGYLLSGRRLGPALPSRADEPLVLYVLGLCLLVGIVYLCIAKLIDLSLAARWWLLVLSIGEFEILLDPRQAWPVRLLGYVS